MENPILIDIFCLLREKPKSNFKRWITLLLCITCGTSCFSNPTPVSHFVAITDGKYEFIFISGSSKINEDDISKITAECNGKFGEEIIKKLGVPNDFAKSTMDYVKNRKVIIYIHQEGDESNIYATLGIDQMVCSYGRSGFLDKYELANIETNLTN